mmetsp:Transcript_29088/g.33338  ORF Transcript_29088/g.33338 Transcript_29088/m.33338 type:complete len:94 (+) Transcript_29088:277-558(+)
MLIVNHHSPILMLRHAVPIRHVLDYRLFVVPRHQVNGLGCCDIIETTGDTDTTVLLPVFLLLLLLLPVHPPIPLLRSKKKKEDDDGSNNVDDT